MDRNEILKVLKAQHDALDILLAHLATVDRTFMPTQSPAWPAVVAGHAAIQKLEREIHDFEE